MTTAVAAPLTLVLEGRVTEAEGAHCAGVAFDASRDVQATVLTDPAGRWTLSLPLGSRPALAQRAFGIVLKPASGSKRIATAAGAAGVVLEIRSDANGSPGWIEARSSDAALARAVAGALADTRSDTARVEVPFVCGTRPRGRGTPRLDYVERVTIGTPWHDTATNAAPAPAAPAPAAAPGMPPSHVTPAVPRVPPHTTVPVREAVHPTAQVADSFPAGCACRIEGTVEVRTDRAPSQGLRVLVWVREAPAIRDTVQMYMGSPRPFVFPRVPCGIRHVDAQIVSRRRFRVTVTPSVVGEPGTVGDAIECSAGRTRQVRIVVEPQ